MAKAPPSTSWRGLAFAVLHSHAGGPAARATGDDAPSEADAITEAIRADPSRTPPDRFRPDPVPRHRHRLRVAPQVWPVGLPTGPPPSHGTHAPPGCPGGLGAPPSMAESGPYCAKSLPVQGSGRPDLRVPRGVPTWAVDTVVDKWRVETEQPTSSRRWAVESFVHRLWTTAVDDHLTSSRMSRQLPVRTVQRMSTSAPDARSPHSTARTWRRAR